LQHLDEERILGAIKLEKDVDGCHPLNIASLVLREKEPLFVPCTAKACLRLLLDRGVPLSGKYAVVIGCSNIAGLPISLLLRVSLVSSLLTSFSFIVNFLTSFVCEGC
jgi:5,10-methylene-tetrahydrofolate dehydrogenase/methenyl tetrahydrofolate cyclohydrolase